MKPTKNDVIELVGIVAFFVGFCALLYGLSILAEWLSYVFGGLVLTVGGFAAMVFANRTGGAS